MSHRWLLSGRERIDWLDNAGAGTEFYDGKAILAEFGIPTRTPRDFRAVLKSERKKLVQAIDLS